MTNNYKLFQELTQPISSMSSQYSHTGYYYGVNQNLIECVDIILNFKNVYGKISYGGVIL